MIALPDGFDYTALVSDFFGFVAPFMGILFLIVAARLIRSAGKQL